MLVFATFEALLALVFVAFEVLLALVFVPLGFEQLKSLFTQIPQEIEGAPTTVRCKIWVLLQTVGSLVSAQTTSGISIELP